MEHKKELKIGKRKKNKKGNVSMCWFMIGGNPCFMFGLQRFEKNN